jgi:uncharacterized protein YdeI (YjbR/CyaY-like superfamily)
MKPASIHVFNNRADTEGYTSEHRNVPLTVEYEDQIKANNTAWEGVTNLAPSYKRDSICWVMSAKKEETRLKRLGILIESSATELKIPSLRKK